MSDVPLIDLHCHLLPGIDDGAKNLDISIELLQRQQADGVAAVMFTPHFYYERKGIEKFLKDRQQAYRSIAQAAKERGIRVAAKLGAEVFFTPALPTLDLSALAFAGTNYILIELPTTHHPSGIEETLFEIQQQGYTPILAHVERYPYVTEDPSLLYQWVEAGALAHINAAGLIRGGHTTRLVQRYIRWGLVHLLCSDAHSLQHRPPNLAQGYAALPPEMAAQFKRNALAVFMGREVDIPEPKEPRYRLGQWV